MKRLTAGGLLLSLIVCCTACGGNHESSNNTEGMEMGIGGKLITLMRPVFCLW